MAICLKCKKKIEVLCSEATATTGCFIDEKGDVIFDESNFGDNAEINEWRCPKCEEVLALDEDEAREFMEDKDELQEIVAEKIEKIKESKN